MTLATQTVNRFGAMLRLPVGATLLLLVLVTYGYATSSSSYSDMWAEQNGDGSVTVWGVGVSDDTPMHGYDHFVVVDTTLTGPNGSYGDVVSSFGYTDSLVDLPAVAGDYKISSLHNLQCGGLFASPSQLGKIGIKILSYEFVRLISPTKARYKRCLPGTDCSPVIVTTEDTGGPLPVHVYVDWITLDTDFVIFCYKTDVDPLNVVQCPPHPLP